MAVKKVDYSFKILEETLMLKKYNSKEEVMIVARKMLEVANKNEKCTLELKSAYKEAYEKLSSLTFDEMKEIIDILSSYDDED